MEYSKAMDELNNGNVVSRSEWNNIYQFIFKVNDNITINNSTFIPQKAKASLLIKNNNKKMYII